MSIYELINLYDVIFIHRPISLSSLKLWILFSKIIGDVKTIIVH